jgi:type III secretion protein V
VSLLRARDVRGLLSRHGDVALAALVVAIVGMMIVPLPKLALDLLISCNFAVAVTLLLVAIHVGDALKIATFPTLLLLTTLYRLALQVSATRLILLDADAGQVIRAFGKFVVAGNLVVGAVIFLILTIIQYVVISRGSERVAEVAARFALDAMPGKQMAIDAELRAGLIDGDEARRRRAHLTRESQLYGSMDGAMKFVKGDAIAGLVVLLVNIVGGLVIGVFQRGMELSAAARTYTVLTVGEGLVAQIPALILSTAAGIIVTRVASEDEGGHLGRDIGHQILRHPKAIAIAAVLLFLLALVPGLPLGPFLALAAVLGLVAFGLLRWPEPRATAAVAATATTAAAGVTAGGAAPAPLTVELGPALAAALMPDGDGDRLAARLAPRLAARVTGELGFPLPPLAARAAATGLGPLEFVLRLDGVPLARGEAARDRPAADAEAALGDHLLALVRRHGHELLGIEQAAALVRALEQTHPVLVREVFPKLVSPAVLAEVLRGLLAEGVPLVQLDRILEAVARWAPSERDPAALVERTRAALRRVISFRHAAADGVLAVHLLDATVEQAIREAVQRSEAGSHLALEPQLAREIIAAVGRATAEQPTSPAGPVLVVAGDIRRHVRHLVEAEHPHIAVLSHAELDPSAKVRTLGAIGAG